ncbi:hypothetical protein HC891_08285 [Candidatus Gracilibacteria bacterium]|nr:hypothetical protein [Candidatus Gracilibacteria bacterium]
MGAHTDSAHDQRGRPLLVADLGALLGSAPPSAVGHGLQIDLRRRSVLLRADHVDEADPALAALLQPLPPLLRQAMARSWICAALPNHDQAILMLDLRQIAQDVVRRETGSVICETYTTDHASYFVRAILAGYCD